MTRKTAGVGLGILLAAAAFPARVAYGLPALGSLSLLDLALIAVGAALALDALRTGRLDVGYPLCLLLLALPALLSLVSLMWSEDLVRSLRLTMVHIEGLIAYLAAVRFCAAMQPGDIITALRRYVYLLLLAPALMLLGVAGFAPQVPGVDVGSTDYVGFFTRLSHPFIGRSNNLATVLAFFLPVLVYWAISRRDRTTSVAAVVALAAVVLTLSRGVLLSLGLAAAAYLVAARPPLGPLLRRASAAGTLVLLAGGLAWAAIPDTRWSFATRFEVAVGQQEREGLVQSGLERIVERPVLGWGSGVAPSGSPELEGGIHNTYLQQALSFGIPLGVAVSACLIGLSWVFWRRHRPGSVARPLGVAVLTQLLSFTVQSSFEGTLLKVLFYLSIGLAVALLRAVEDELSTEGVASVRSPEHGATGAVHRLST